LQNVNGMICWKIEDIFFIQDKEFNNSIEAPPTKLEPCLLMPIS